MKRALKATVFAASVLAAPNAWDSTLGKEYLTRSRCLSWVRPKASSPPSSNKPPQTTATHIWQ
jgi:hypothetical protein